MRSRKNKQFAFMPGISGTEIKDIRKALNNSLNLAAFRLMTIDAFFLNEDRHTHNISVLWNEHNKYCLCPFYDQGAALMSDTSLEYPLGCDVLIEKNRIHSKTFCTSFDEQLDLAEELYGRHLVFSWGAKDVDDILGSVNGYDEQIISRVRDLLLEQRRKYAYLFA